MDLLSSSESEDEQVQRRSRRKTPKVVDENKLQINEKFAADFERRERYKELQRKKDLLLQDGEEDEDSESEESEDEDAELLSQSLDVQILKTINSIKKKDPKIYDPQAKWFSEDSGSEEEEEGSDENGGQKHKKMRFKDVLRSQLQSSTGDDEDADEGQDHADDHLSSRKSQLLYNAEQEELRRAFLKAAGQTERDGEGDSDGEELLRTKKKSARELQAEEEEYQRALAEMRTLEEQEKGEDERERDREAFLHTFLSKQLWKEKGTSSQRTPLIAEDEEEEDEAAVEAAEDFESRYNFRFEEVIAEGEREEEDQDAVSRLLAQQRHTVIGHARAVPDSLRRVDEKRKQQRESRKEKKEREKRQREAELRRLKNLKREELRERLKQIESMGGVHDLRIDEDFLDEDWDPEKHEALMAQQFDEDYYAQTEDADVSLEETEALLRDTEEMDDEPVEGQGESEERAEVSRLMDEYYALDYEDEVAGLKCRFRYREVPREDFGLQTEDILLADDAELNRYVSLKKLAPYRDRSSSGKDLSKKRKRLRQVLKERQLEVEERLLKEQEKRQKRGDKRGKQQTEVVAEETAVSEEPAKKKRRKRNKKKKAPNAEGSGGEEGEEEGEGEE